MSNRINYSQLDQPHILMFVFHPRLDWTPPPLGSTDHTISIENQVDISGRFYISSTSAPTILFFHGNGEIACDYDEIAPLYNALGINLFVVDYRGYGKSTGRPTFSSTISDAHSIFNYFRNTLLSNGYTGSTFIMGRSLGSLSAIEIASSYPKYLSGLIIESGFASTSRLLSYLHYTSVPLELDTIERENIKQIRSITSPVLIIHGEYDEIIPYEQAEIIFRNTGSSCKQLVKIPKAGHNDIMLIGIEEYFAAIYTFIFQNPL